MRKKLDTGSTEGHRSTREDLSVIPAEFRVFGDQPFSRTHA